MSKRRSPGSVRQKFHHTKPAVPKYLSHIVPQKQLQTPEGHPESDQNLQQSDQSKPWGQAPPDKYMTEPEWAVYWALTKLIGEQNFFWRYPVPIDRYIGGYYAPFVDFFIPEKQLVLLLDYETGEGQIAFGSFALSHDLVIKKDLENTGLTVIMIDATDANTDPIFFVSEALQGRDHSLDSFGKV